jgi:Secretion system C-terminal sorting domain
LTFNPFGVAAASLHLPRIAAQAPVLEAQMMSLTVAMGLVVDANYTLLGSISANIEASAPAVKATNTAITAVPAYQNNEKKVNDILLGAIGNGGLDFSASQTLLEAIANQCPYVGGNAVFRARSMMALIDPEVAFDDAVLCQPNFGGQNLPPVAIQTAGTAGFYPNPANDWLTVDYNFPDAESLTLTIYNANGMEVERVALNETIGSQAVSIQHLTNGLYFCKILDNDRTLIVNRIAIMR